METLRQMAGLNWIDVKIPRLPPGARIAILQGSLREPGPLVFDLYLPPGYSFPAHYHETDEQVTTLSGSVFLGGMDGSAFNRAAGKRLGPGELHKLPAHMPHWVYTGSQSVIARIDSSGPYAIRWVEDPRP